MTLNAELLTMLVCPNCGGDVDYDEPQQVIECGGCHYRYPVRDDIPVMLVDEAEKPAGHAEKPAGDDGAERTADNGTPTADA